MGAEARLGRQDKIGWNGTYTSWYRVMLALCGFAHSASRCGYAIRGQ
jgi:hypothetical protein